MHSEVLMPALKLLPEYLSVSAGLWVNLNIED